MNTYIPIIVAVLSAAVSIGIAIYNYLVSWKNNRITHSISAIDKWNSHSSVQSRECLYVTLAKQQAWSAIREDTAIHNQVYTALASLDTLGFLLREGIFDKEKFGDLLKPQAVPLAKSASAVWPSLIENEFPNLKYLAETG